MTKSCTHTQNFNISVVLVDFTGDSLLNKSAVS